MAHLLQPIVEVTALLDHYRGILPMAVGTGAGRKSAMVQLDTLQLTSYFDAIVTADDVEFHKPEPHTFLKCAEIMGVEPHLCQVFEDGDLGIEAAIKAGMMVTDIRPYISYGNWGL
jgi:HAD superfamily hydrolase (TIGR01509 family)